MLELIITILVSLGINFNSGSHFTMSNNVADKIKNSAEYRERGGDAEFSKYVSVDDKSLDDIVITDDDNPERYN